jgi:hypothetical protein
MITKSMIPAVCVVVKSLTLQEAIEILRRLCQDHLHRTLYVETQTVGAKAITFLEIGTDARNLIAPLTSFWRFWMETGPPLQREWRESTLCQYVADCLLIEVGLQGEKIVSDIVGDVIRKDAP